MVILLFLAILFLLGWAYLGYPLFIASPAGRLLPRPLPRTRPLGRTWLLISAYNEEAVIGRKLANATLLKDSDLEIVVISDGSTDRTDAIALEHAARDPRIRLVRVEGRLGKNHALNRCLERLPVAPDDVIVFSDANASYETGAVRHLREALAEGAACAVGRLVFVDERTGTARAEGMYWRYENQIKRAEGRLGRLLVANGAIFAARAAVVPELPLGVGNDFWMPVSLLGNGRSVVYVPRAVAYEAAPERGREEFLRKVRMANRSMQGTMALWRQIDGPTRWQLLSHKVLRWFGLPLYAAALALSGVLAGRGGGGVAIFVLMLLPLGLAAVGALGRMMGVRVPGTNLGVHFLLVHAAAFWGVVEAIRGKERLTWERAHSARRATVS